MAHIKAVCTSETTGQAKKAVDQVELKTNFGIIGDAHADADTHRQISLMDEQSIKIMRQKGYDAADGDFGENFVTVDLPITQIGIGTILQLGSSARLKITQIGKACHTPCAIGRRTGQCIMPTEGIFAVVLAGGTVLPGDPIAIIKKVDRSTVQVAVITASDRCSAGQTLDTSGPLIAQTLSDSRLFECNIAQQYILPDDREIITDRLKSLSEPERYIDLIFTTGGTGLAPRDVTPEATTAVIDRPVPGIAQAIRQKSLTFTPMAMLSRAVAGIRGRTLIINLPGSTKAVRESLEVILPILPHAVELLRGQPTDCGRDRQAAITTRVSSDS